MKKTSFTEGNITNVVKKTKGKTIYFPIFTTPFTDEEDPSEYKVVKLYIDTRTDELMVELWNHESETQKRKRFSTLSQKDKEKILNKIDDELLVKERQLLHKANYVCEMEGIRFEKQHDKYKDSLLELIEQTYRNNPSKVGVPKIKTNVFRNNDKFVDVNVIFNKKELPIVEATDGSGDSCLLKYLKVEELEKVLDKIETNILKHDE